MQTRLIAKARNETTKVTVQNRNQYSNNFTVSQRKLAQNFADQYARKLSVRTGDTWTGFVEEYTPGTNVA
tara:strand:+ start:142 stop:351 length:210 start_codon:yes stop_codon:yes gene_type:complete